MPPAEAGKMFESTRNRVGIIPEVLADLTGLLQERLKAGPRMYLNWEGAYGRSTTDGKSQEKRDPSWLNLG